MEKKIYLESQRSIFNAEIKKLFAINSNLESKIADMKLELLAYSNQSEMISQASQQEKTTL